jgi:hypothetical protein
MGDEVFHLTAHGLKNVLIFTADTEMETLFGLFLLRAFFVSGSTAP